MEKAQGMHFQVEVEGRTSEKMSGGTGIISGISKQAFMRPVFLYSKGSNPQCKQPPE